MYLLYNKIKKIGKFYDNKIMLQKKIMIFMFLIISSVIFAQISVQMIHKDSYHFLDVYENKSIPIETGFNLLRTVDKTQTHRVILNSIEKSRLNSLLFIGDSFSFNNQIIMKKSPVLYSIKDLLAKVEIDFSLGSYDDIILHSYVNFYNIRYNTYKDIDEYDKIASGMAVKLLLDKLTGTLSTKPDLPLVLQSAEYEKIKFDLAGDNDFRVMENSFIVRNTKEYYLRQNLTGSEEVELRRVLDKVRFEFSKRYTDTEKMKMYYDFVEQLKEYGTTEDIFDKLQKFVNFNFMIIDEYSIDSDWTNPYDLFYNKKGDYKSIAFFYYYTFNQMDIDCQGYFVTPLTRKQIPDNVRYSLEHQNAMLMEKKINPISNLDLRKYKEPEFSKAVFLITIQYNKKWIYTTGNKWVFSDILSMDRVTAHYSRNGCYYSVFKDEKLIINNIPINPDSIRWDVFFDISSFVE